MLGAHCEQENICWSSSYATGIPSEQTGMMELADSNSFSETTGVTPHIWWFCSALSPRALRRCSVSRRPISILSFAVMDCNVPIQTSEIPEIT